MTLSAARNFLDSQGMSVTEEWLTGCIEYFSGESSRNELMSMVKSQWLLGDLRDISPGNLPPGLGSVTKTTLNGIYALQVDRLIDIGTPAYQQLQKIQRIDVSDIDATNEAPKDPPPQRMLKMALTDGIQDICGIEYKPMRNLNTALIPGVKVQIKGPVDCRRGVLMLEEKHITVLGGEVEDLIESNSYKNILVKKLENGSNTVSVENFTRVKVDSVPIPRPNIPKEQNRTSVSTVNFKSAELNDDMFVDDDIDIEELDAIENHAVHMENKQSAHQAPIVIDDSLNFDDFDEPIEEPKKMRKVDPIAPTTSRVRFSDDLPIANRIPKCSASENKSMKPKIEDSEPTYSGYINSSAVNRNMKPKTEEPEPMYSNYINSKKNPISSIFAVNKNMKSKPEEMEPTYSGYVNSNKNPYGSIADKDKNTNDFKPSSYSNYIDLNEIIDIEPATIESYVSIRQILSTSDALKSHETFKVRAAKVSKVIGKLSLQRNLWVLRCTIQDDTAQLDVDVCNDVLSKVIGYTPDEVVALKKQMATRPELKGKLVEALENALTKLTSLKCSFHVEYKDGSACVTQVEESQHIYT